MLIWIIEWSFANLRILIKVLFIQSINLIRSVPKFILDKNISLLYWRGGRFRTKGKSLSKYWNISTWTGPPSMLLFQIRHSDQKNQPSTSKPASQEIIRAVPAFPLHHSSTSSETCSPPSPSALLPPPSARRENLCPANTIPGMLHAPCILLYWQLLPVSQHKASYVRSIIKFYWGNLSIYIIFHTFYFSPPGFSVFGNVILPSERTGAQITDPAGAHQEPSTTSQSTSGSERSQAGGI